MKKEALVWHFLFVFLPPTRYAVPAGAVHSRNRRGRRACGPRALYRTWWNLRQGRQRRRVEGNSQVSVFRCASGSDVIQAINRHGHSLIMSWPWSHCCHVNSGGWNSRKTWKTEGNAGANLTLPPCRSTACLSSGAASSTAACCLTCTPTALRRSQVAVSSKCLLEILEQGWNSNLHVVK